MRPFWLNRTFRSAALVAVATATLGVTAAAAKPEPGARRTRALNLFAGAGLLLQANRVVCGLANIGEVCVAFVGSPVGGGGFWPKGTPDQYIFNSGLWLAGVVDPAAGFAWAGDTTGGYIFDPRGTQVQGDGITAVFDGASSADLAAWPNGAVVRDASIYHPALLGLNTISQQDSWVRYWEGDPTFLSGRVHPLGILIEQRSLAWNYPSGNEDILYFVFTFYNVTARSTSTAYDGLDPAIRAEVAAVGDRFQSLNEAKYGIAIPDGGYAVDDMYASYAMDNDVAVFSTNYSTAVLPFNLGATYAGDFLPEVGWQYPPSIFGAPFAPATGFVAAKYLRSPESSPGVEVGLTMFSNTLNSATGFPDPVGVQQLYRYMSGFLGAGDFPCTIGGTNYAIARQRRLCFLAAQQADSRFYAASGPFTLPPGESRSIVVAVVHAAPLAAPLAALPTGGIGANNPPGVPFTGDTIFVRPGAVRPIDRVMGWVSERDVDGDRVIEQGEVTTAPRSLLNKANRAQAVYDAGFLLPFSPQAPDFFLVPGDNRVTVVWKASATESGDGDAYFSVASAPFTAGGSPNPLYDPNFRQYDVEGYRIYRGRTAGDLHLIAQFDYAGTSLIDYTGAFDYGAGCAPELGIMTDCPVAFDTIPPNTGPAEPHPLTGNVIQVAPGARTELADGSVFILSADTAVTGAAARGNAPIAGTVYPSLEDTGVPFAYVDNGVRNSFTYFYVVTAFDVNSISSGPTSLESGVVTKRVTPRAAAGQETAGALSSQSLVGGDGSTLTIGPVPVINPATGTFAGPMPPTDGIDVGLVAFLPNLLGDGSLTVTIDSVVPGFPELDVLPGRYEPTLYYMTGQGAGAPVKFTVALEEHEYEEEREARTPFEATAIDASKATRFGGDASFSLYGQAALRSAGLWVTTSFGRGDANSVPPNSAYNGPRWWAGATNENTNNPNGGVCAPSAGGCGNTVPVPNLALSSGAIAGVTIMHVQSYNTVPNSPMRILEGLLATVLRAADFRVHWGANGAVDSVVDVTHKVRVPFSTKIRASWGILTQGSFAATNASLTRDANNALLTWSDIFCVAPAPAKFSTGGAAAGNCGGTAQTPAVLVSTATLSPIAVASSAYANAGTLTATGNGFIFYLNGHFFLMQMAALPAAGTAWNARFYSGSVTGTAADGDFAFAPAVRPPAVPGLRLQVTYEGSTFDPTTVTDLSRVHTVPDPYYVTNALEITTNQKFLKFVNLPSRAIIRIYSVSGVLVAVIAHDDATDGGEATWNLRNRNNQFVATGVYFYHVETPSGQSRVGRFTIVNFAP